MNVAFEPGTTWLYQCLRCGAEYVLQLRGGGSGQGEGWVYADCCPFCHSRDILEKGAADLSTPNAESSDASDAFAPARGWAFVALGKDPRK